MSVQQQLERAERLCEQRSVRFTPTRRHVFTLIAGHKGAVSAYELLDQLKELEPNAKPPTVYRALDFLLAQGFVHKVESLNAFLFCEHFAEHHPMQLLICTQCGDVIELHDEAINRAFEHQAELHGFAITSQSIEAHGQCRRCRSENTGN
ncbi:transcriptional repressor [Oceanimonas baumannii]|uniref:Ferric uptake regulation protein n=1 Tax=Oceanimonas baumannii TaxID=129578 RepID=A0A235CLV5_9GAMM|nr:transcriptional repressor [Oceanimonas baumannii]MCC4266041.1 transcriptional repressor [Oceanimonas baumannii]OYD25416.1 transcriptional repressor [Oceanimonas baumannii]TDW61391.1 Fur family zinc uptake transcriptional regulator [Oceanimonas baumannii]